MITQPTVLVLGAGASVDSGFPVARALTQTILRDLGDPNGVKFRELREAGFPPESIRSFREDLLFSGSDAVDAFLEHRRNLIDVGKAAIAQALIPCEHLPRLFARTTPNWYQYLIQRLNAPPDQFDQNKLSVVTFNYDRSLETFIFMALKKRFDLTDKEAVSRLKAIPIVHVHGQMGYLPWQGEPSRDYNTRLTPSEIKIAAQGIKVIHEKIDSDSEFSKAHRLLSEANRILFLGFGYDETNLRRLKIDSFRTGQLIVGSYYGAKSLEQTIVELKFKKNIKIYVGDVIDTLRNMVIL